MEKSAIIFSWNLWFSNGWYHVWKLTSVSYWLPAPLPPPIVECHVIGQWIDINIVKLCIHKTAGSGINEIIFPSFSWTYTCLLNRTRQIVCTVYHKYANLFLYPPKISKAYAFMYVFSHYRSLSTECPWFSLVF